MPKHNPGNERIKRQYFTHLKEARRYSEASVDSAADALAGFERYTRWRDFRAFHIDQAVAFKKHLAEQRNVRTGKPLSTATLHTTLTNLKRFFGWLADQPGFKSRIRHTDAEYFNLSEKDARTASARREQSYPTLEQVRYTLTLMPNGSPIERRDPCSGRLHDPHRLPGNRYGVFEA